MRRLRESARAFRDVFGNRDLCRLELAWAGSIIGTWAYLIAISVYAYEHGGATAVGLVSAARWLSGAAASPFAALLADRFDRRRVMVASNVTQTALVALAGVATVANAPAAVVYLLAVLVAVATTAFRPAEAALTATLARTPEELTAANVVGSTIESVGILAGPALAGLLLAAAGAATVFFATAGCLLLSTALVLSLHPRPREREQPARPEPITAELFAGVRTIAREPRLRLIIGLFSAQSLTAGMLKVLVVVIAFQLLDSGEAGVGFLNSAIGVGGLLGALAVAALVVGREKLASSFGVGILIWGLPIALIAAWPNQASALVLLGIVGIGYIVSDVSGTTLLQRSAPEDVLGRVFGVLGSVFLLMWALGGLIAPLLLSLLGPSGALIAVGAFQCVVVVAAWPALVGLDRSTTVPTHRLDLLRAVPIFAPLPEPTLEQLALGLEKVAAPAGATIFRQGDDGDRFYVVDEGMVEVHLHGRPPSELGPGEFFGEIALMREVPRTATVCARTDVRLYALHRNAFIPAVTGHVPSRVAADKVIGARLGPGATGLVRA
jgi:MFS family permease